MAVTCSACGAQNDEVSRFCDQCGAALSPATEPAAAAPATVATTCPSCGASVLPGEAFCDECGAELKSVAAPVSADAPTVLAVAPVAPAGAEGLCPACGHQNLPGDRFCDQCGAELPLAGAVPPATPGPVLEPVPAEEPVSPPDPVATVEPTTVAPPPASTEESAPPSAPVEEAAPMPAPTEEATSVAVPIAEAAPVAVPVEETPSAAVPIAEAAPTPMPVEEAAPVAAPAQSAAEVIQAAVNATPALTMEEYQAEKARLENEIDLQQKLVTQFEQMQATFGPATPSAVTQGLAAAHSALAAAQARLDTMVAPTPPIDPEEVRRIESEIELQQKLVTQFEQMQATFGPAAPPAVTQGLAEARNALAAAQARRDALLNGGSPPPTTLAMSPSTPLPTDVAPTTVAPAPAADLEPTVFAPLATPAAEDLTVAAPLPTPMPDVAPVTTPNPPPAPAARPRLVVETTGIELPLDPDLRTFIVGREDPISGIHPEVDLTSHGGESGGVSRQHARIERNGDQWSITDLDSTNYTRVNGTRIEPNTPVPVPDGARLQLGRVVLLFHAA